jgi:hypothetical protein
MARPPGQARPNTTEAAYYSVTSLARRCPEDGIRSSLSSLCEFPSDFTASTFDLATARKGVVRSEVPQPEAAVERPGIPRTVEAVASLAAG